MLREYSSNGVEGTNGNNSGVSRGSSRATGDSRDGCLWWSGEGGSDGQIKITRMNFLYLLILRLRFKRVC